MSLSKGRSAITQLTSSGTSTTMDASASYNHVLLVKHSNGTGSVTVAGLIKVQVKSLGGASWFTMAIVSASLVTSAVDDFVIPLPDSVNSVQVVYTVPTGATSPTLDAEIATLTGL